MRILTGLDEPVREFLESNDEVHKMFANIKDFLETWLPRFEADNRSYMTVAIGCTGGHHRSVYMCARLHDWFSSRWKNVQVRHRDLK